MDTDLEEKSRRIIPRWRSFHTTISLGELQSSAPLRLRPKTPESSIDEQVTDWVNNRSLAFATDLVGASLVVGEKADEVEDAADFILSDGSLASDLQKRIARQAKDPDHRIDLTTPDELNITSGDDIVRRSANRIRKYRSQLREAPRNPVRLVELSREYAIVGSLDKAVRTMDIAVKLGPSNRFVLRSAARLYVHAGMIDKAHYVLKLAPSLRIDPWLLAAEIAVTSMMGTTSNHVRTGMRQLGDSNYNSFELSELASAVATLEMENAKSKVARKLFRQALVTPTENSIAQAEWASRVMGNLPVEVRKYDAPLNFEALAWSHFRQGGFGSALEEGKKWILDQPFAVPPVMFAGTAATIMEDYTLTGQIYTFGLQANFENSILRNNLAFALASNDQPELAEVELEKINRASITIQERITTTATEGLIKFRKGFHEEGRALYRRAINMARESKEHSHALRALVYLAREEIRARTEFDVETLELAKREAKSFQLSQEMTVLLQRLENDVKPPHGIADLPAHPNS